MNDGYIVTASLKTFGQKMNSYPAIVKELPKGEKGIIHMEVATYFEPLKKRMKAKRETEIEEAHSQSFTRHACPRLPAVFLLSIRQGKQRP